MSSTSTGFGYTITVTVRPPLSMRTLLLRRLGLGPEATYDDARRAYRQLAKAHHPDRGGERDEFQAIQAAWETLTALEGWR